MPVDEVISIDVLMRQSGVQFGTSGARGLAEAMTDRICYAYSCGFLNYLADQGQFQHGDEVALAGDFRPSSARIMTAVAAAVEDCGGVAVNLGCIPTPALALYTLQRNISGVMVTGSHIPDDRNGIKFYKPDGELLKVDETAMRQQQVTLPEKLFTSSGLLSVPFELPPERAAGYQDYLRRYLQFFPRECLRGLRIGLYQHSSVARGLLSDVLQELGAQGVPLGYSDRFVPVDTEAIRPQDVVLAREWSSQHHLDALVSTDGDGDRPLIGDENGEWLRGDVVGVLCARYLGIRHLVTPVSSNSLVERCGWFEQVERTRIGSPYVIEAMDRALLAGRRAVAGYEANGGFLLADEVSHGVARLAPLPTRDALIVILSVLMLARQSRLSLAQLVSTLPHRFTHSDRLKDFPTELSQAKIATLNSGDSAKDMAAAEAIFTRQFGRVETIDVTDGVRITFASGEVVHLRPSGNAPELRCYTEADSPDRAAQINRLSLDILASWRG